jgi:superfamily II DNA/RNA helicase
MSETFAHLGLPPELVSRLTAHGIAEPFSIQAATLPDTLAGRDVCGAAPAGSGKTIAFGLTLAMRVRPGKPRRPRALVLVPTRELASQVHDELSWLIADDARRVVAVYGGIGYGAQRQALRRGAAVVVACPGRLEDLVAQGDVDLRDVDLVVLDEADRMCDMGFLPAVRRLLDQTSSERQTLLFSATLDVEVARIVRDYQRHPQRHNVNVEPEAHAVTHLFWKADRSKKVQLTAELVGHHGSAIVFCRTRHGTDRVARQLAAAGVQAVAIHGSRSQPQRERALAAFAAGRATALVATDVAARGIHVDNVGCVVHFDLAGDANDYVHRSGRTGRAGAAGTVVSLVAQEEHAAVRSLQRKLGFRQHVEVPGRDIEPRPVHTKRAMPAASRNASPASASPSRGTRRPRRHIAGSQPKRARRDGRQRS